MTKLYYTSNANHNDDYDDDYLGSFSDDDFESMASEAREHVEEMDDIYDCDKLEYIEESLRLRGYYSFGYGAGRAYIVKED